MLQVDLRELARGPVETQGQLAGNDPLFEGLDVVLADPVHVAGRLHAAGEGRFYWRGSLHTRMAGQCRRCLVPVPVPVVAEIDGPLSRTRSATETDDLTAVPKRRTSKRKKRARRTHYKAAPIALQPCPRCGDLKRPHRVCPTCGYYRDEQRVPVEDA